MPPNRRLGIADWAVPIIGVLLNSSSETVNYQMKTLVGGENYAFSG